MTIGAGIGGMPMAYEMKDLARPGDQVTVIALLLKPRNINFIHQAAARGHPEASQVELADGSRVDYDYLIVATGPKHPWGFVLVDEHQRNPRYPNIFAVGVCVSIPPWKTPPCPWGRPRRAT